MGQALYRKYRSKKLDEIVGQQAVVTALNNALNNNLISHAYLFTGPRGVGKTSVARILAHEINKIPYESDDLPIDIIEIDAASNRRIDEIRDLRDKVRIAPVNAKYKVYIIDEVHMLTKEAFNALLKTLEEPPEHVIFILATTESHKLPETIISRTQKYDFKLASVNEVTTLLKSISKKESININDKSLEIIAEHSGGSLRDAISLLDQIRHSSKDIKEAEVRLNFGLPSQKLTDNIYKALLSKEPKNIILELDNAQKDGVSPKLIAEQLLKDLRERLTVKNSEMPTSVYVSLIKDLIEVTSSNKPDVSLEIALIDSQLVLESQTTSYAALEIKSPEPHISDKPSAKKTAKIEELDQPIQDIANKELLNEQSWPDVLNDVKKSYNTLYGVLRMADPDFSNVNNSQLLLNFKFAFHRKKMGESKNLLILNNSLNKLGYGNFEIICDTTAKKTTTTEAEQQITSDNTVDPATDKPVLDEDITMIDQIKSVFGAVEVLE